MSFRNFVSENIILPVSDLATGQSATKYFRFFKKTEKWTRSQIDEYQNERLRMLIHHAVSNVPYYRDLFKSLGLTADDIRTKADLYKIPVVDKNIMRKEGLERFTAEGFPPKKRIAERSGGSTGEPLSYYITDLCHSVNLATKLRTWYSAGYRLGDKYMKIANGSRNGIVKKAQDWFNNSIYVPFSAVSDADLTRILDLIEKEKPLFIRSYPSPLYLLAKQRSKSKGYSFTPKCIFTTGATLPDNYRSTIEEAFGCRIVDSYSCEGNANVSQCETGTYHVSEEYGITEVLDADNAEVTSGIGRVISTDLWNYAHPFIRYNTQDLVEVDGKDCGCGNKHRPIKRIMGRECESFITANGKYFTVHDLTGYLKNDNEVSEAIDAYQVVKKKDDTICFRIVPNGSFSKALKERLIDHWSGQFKKTVTVELVNEIPLLHNNKHLSIIEEK